MRAAIGPWLTGNRLGGSGVVLEEANVIDPKDAAESVGLRHATLRSTILCPAKITRRMPAPAGQVPRSIVGFRGCSERANASRDGERGSESREETVISCPSSFCAITQDH